VTEPQSTSSGAYLRHPHLHGDLVAFVAEDDVWLAPLDGGRAWRLTADQTPVSHPRFSPDGRHVAWTSTRDGAPEIHVAPTDGGPSRRLTHWGSPRTALRGWTADGRPIAVTTAGQATLRRSWAFAVPLDGGEPTRLPYGPIGGLAPEPDGDRVLLLSAFSREPAHWKRYRGGTVGKLWIGGREAGGEEFRRLHADLDGNVESPLWVGGRIAFLSDHEGTGQLYSSLPDGSDLRRHSDHAFYARNASTDGRRVIWHSAGDLWLLEDLDGAGPRRLDVRPAGPRTRRQPHPTPAAGQLSTADLDRTGRASAVVVRGTVHWLTHREGPARVLDATPGVRNRDVRVVPGTDGVQGAVWVSDAGGEDALVYAPAVLEAERRTLAAGRLGRVRGLAVSPDGKQLAVASHDGRVLLVALSDGTVHELDRSENGEVSGLVFSPDSGWLAWSRPVLGPWSLRQIMLADLTSRTVSEATQQRFLDYSPAFTADGRHLAFLSVRNFDPVYDAHSFDLSFPTGCRPYLITLAADTPSPFGPRRAGRAASGEEDDAKPAGKDAKESGEGADAVPEPTRVDLEGIADRILPFPVEGGSFDELCAAKDGVLWTRVPLLGQLGDNAASLEDDHPRPVLERFDFAKRRAEELSAGVDGWSLCGDGTRLAVLDGTRLRIVPADRKAGEDDEVDVDLARLRVTVDPAAEWRQMFDENGRIMRDNFWRADMNGVDWDGVLERYRPLVDRVGTHDDLVDLLWETVGELGTSHAYVTPPGRGTDSARRQGLLGADLVRDGDVWRIARVLPGESSDPRARSPLAAPGVAVRPGDAVLAVDGRPVDPVTGPAPLLAGTAGQPVELTVAGKDGVQRHPVVVPLADEEALRYHDWVAGRRAEVRELSGGRLGYLHVPDMVSSGWAQLHRDLRVELAREGVIVDLRENRGGHTSQLIVEKLNRRIIGWDRARDLANPEPYPGDAPRGPVVALANEFSGSDGDIVNAAIQALGIGPVVGTRTWGGVIGIDGKYALVDGTGITQPKYAFWLEGYGWGVENHGVDPDVEVQIAPHDWAAGRDPQLAEGVRLALAALAERPARTPPPVPGL
jgi:tricorn protease